MKSTCEQNKLECEIKQHDTVNQSIASKLQSNLTVITGTSTIMAMFREKLQQQ